MGPLDLNVMCDQRNTARSHGNHHKCCKARQAQLAERRAQENYQ